MAILPRQLPQLDRLGLAPELKTAIRQISQRVYQLRDQAATENVDAEIPSGPLDGANTRFQLAFPPIPASSLQLFHNGLLLLAEADYTLTGKSLVYAVAPAMADWHRTYYRKIS